MESHTPEQYQTEQSRVMRLAMRKGLDGWGVPNMIMYIVCSGVDLTYRVHSLVKLLLLKKILLALLDSSCRWLVFSFQPTNPDNKLSTYTDKALLRNSRSKTLIPNSSLRQMVQ